MRGEPRVSRPTAEKIYINNEIIQNVCGENVPNLTSEEQNKIIGKIL
jgi:hypothetical protein